MSLFILYGKKKGYVRNTLPPFVIMFFPRISCMDSDLIYITYKITKFRIWRVPQLVEIKAAQKTLEYGVKALRVAFSFLCRS